MEISLKEEKLDGFIDEEIHERVYIKQEEINCKEEQTEIGCNFLSGSESYSVEQDRPFPFETQFIKNEIETESSDDSEDNSEKASESFEQPSADSFSNEEDRIVKKNSEVEEGAFVPSIPEKIVEIDVEHKKNNNLVSNLLYKCSLCKHRCDSRDDYVKHMNNIHGLVRPAAAAKRFKCRECDKQFTRSSSLKRHMQFHTGVWPLNCSVCNKGFNSSCNLTIHMRIHTGEKPFKCEQCDAVFTHLPSFKRHMRVHAGETPYMCVICKRGFTDSGVLKVHMRTHTGEKPFVCSVCNKTFTVTSSLNKHMQIHMDEKPFKCTICNKGFTQAVSFRRHLKVHV